MKFDLNLKLYSDTVNGITMNFLDNYNSWAVPNIFEEFKENPYGIDDSKLTPEDILVDVGANVGMFSIYAHKKFGCKIIAFEPVIENIENFKRNILLNKLDPNNFEIHNLAITGNKNDRVKIGVQSWNSGGCSIFYKNPGNTIEVMTDTLHGYVNENCKFLKLDCEGSEYSIIPSILDIVNKFDYIGIEYHDMGESYDANKTHEILKKNFTGKIYPEFIGKIPKIQSYVL